MKLILQKPDNLGVMASSLCMVHCLATPFLFMTQAGSVSCCEATPIWWKLMDFIFLTISFIAIYWSTKTTSSKWVKSLLWLNGFILLIMILNEKLETFPVAEAAIYVPIFSLIILHLYNRKYCNCASDQCCLNEG